MAFEKESKKLKLFNEKVGKLVELSFTKHITTTKTHFTVNFTPGLPVEIVEHLPTGESFDAFVVTFRQFIQNNDPISIANIAKLYEKIPISQKLKDDFKDARKAYNKYLNDKSNITLKGKIYSNREVMKAFIYGGIAHSTPSMRETFEKFMQNNFLKVFSTTIFAHILSYSLQIVYFLKQVNEKSIKELGK